MSEHTDTKRDQELLAQLDEETARLLFPERFAGPLEITLIHPPLQGKAAKRARQLASGNPVEVDEDGTEHVTFTLRQLETLYEMYALLEANVDAGALRVLINGKQLPMVRELWLPLLWCLRS